MGALLFCRGGHLGFCLIILLALSLCYGNHVTVNVEGFVECAHCIPVGATASGTRPRMNIDCLSRGGDLRTLGAGDVDDRGNFKIKFLQDKILNDQVQRGSCFLKLDGVSGAPCPGQEVQNVLVMIFKSIDNVKQTAAMMRKLKFPSMRCTSTVLWPYEKKNEQLINIPPSPGKSFAYPHQPSVKAFLSPKSGPVEALPPYAKTFNTSLPPPASMKKNSKPLSALISRKLLTLPVNFFSPIFPPLPRIQYLSPIRSPLVGNPSPTPIPTIKKPLPPPTPISSNYKPSPAPTAISTKPLPPPAPILKEPVLAPAPIVSIPKKPPPPSRPNFVKPLPPVPPPMPHFNNPLPPMAQAPEIAPPPHFQRLVPSTAPPPLVKTPHFPPLAPTYKNPIPVPPPMHSPEPALQKPNRPPVPTFKKSAPPPHPREPVEQPNAPLHPPIPPKRTTPAPTYSARPVLQKPNTPPVPTFNKSAPPPLQSPKAPVRPPISPTPMLHPSPKPPHKSAPSPLPIVNPAPPTKEPPYPQAPKRKSFSPIPKAPPIPKLPPIPTVPRKYFNSPKSRYQPPSPPS